FKNGEMFLCYCHNCEPGLTASFFKLGSLAAATEFSIIEWNQGSSSSSSSSSSASSSSLEPLHPLAANWPIIIGLVVAAIALAVGIGVGSAYALKDSSTKNTNKTNVKK